VEELILDKLLLTDDTTAVVGDEAVLDDGSDTLLLDVLEMVTAVDATAEDDDEAVPMPAETLLVLVLEEVAEELMIPPLKAVSVTEDEMLLGDLDASEERPLVEASAKLLEDVTEEDGEDPPLEDKNRVEE